MAGRKIVELTSRAALRASSGLLAIDPSAIGSSIELLDSAPDGHTRDDRRVGVALVDVFGPLAQRGAESFCMAFLDGYDLIASRFAAALSDEDVTGVVLRIDSPGGDVAGLEQCVANMRASKESAGKPVVAYIDELAASAAYWLAACVADRIVLPPMGRVGSIGCIGVIEDHTGANAQSGVAITLVRDPAGKAPGNPDGPIMDLATRRMTEDVVSASNIFAAEVAAARGLDPQGLRALDAAILTGQAALDAGLADEIGTLQTAVGQAYAQGETIMGSISSKVLSALGITPAATEQDIRRRLHDAGIDAAAPPPPAKDEKPADAPPPQDDGKVKQPSSKSGLPEVVTNDDGTTTCPQCGAVFWSVKTKKGGARASEALAAGLAALDLTGQADPIAALEVVRAWQESHVAAQQLRIDLAAEQARADRAERDELVAKLVADCGETPPSAWADPMVAGDKDKRVPAEPWASMSLEALRARVETLSSVPNGARRSFEPLSPDGLTAEEREWCKRNKVTAEHYVAAKAKCGA